MNENQNKLRSVRFPIGRVFVCGLIAFIVIGLVTPHLTFIHQPRFVRHWSERLRTIDSLDAAKRFGEGEPVFVRAFPSGEWLIATCEHSCCSGAGFDATVIRDSTGAIYSDTTHTFCGIEGMSSELSQVSAEALSAFYPRLTQLKLQKQ